MTIRKLYWLAHHFFSICCVHFSLLPGSLVQLHILSSPQKYARNPAYTPKYKKKADFISSLLWEWVRFTASLHIACNSSAQVSVWAQNGTIKSTFLMRELGKVTKYSGKTMKTGGEEGLQPIGLPAQQAWAFFSWHSNSNNINNS